MELKVASVDKGGGIVREFGTHIVFCNSRTLVIESLKDMIHGISAVHNQQVLIDREDAI